MSYQRAKTRHPFKCITRHAKRERNRFHKIGATIIRAHPVLSQSACIALAGVFCSQLFALQEVEDNVVRNRFTLQPAPHRVFAHFSQLATRPPEQMPSRKLSPAERVVALVRGI